MKKFGWLVRVLCVSLCTVGSVSCEDASQSEEASHIADPVLKKLQEDLKTLTAAEKSRVAMMAAVPTTLPGSADCAALVASYDSLTTAMTEAKTNLAKAERMDLFPVQKKYYSLQIAACTANVALIEAATTQMTALSAYVSSSRGVFDKARADSFLKGMEETTKNLDEAKEKATQANEAVQQLLKDYPNSFRPLLD